MILTFIEIGSNTTGYRNVFFEHFNSSSVSQGGHSAVTMSANSVTQALGAVTAVLLNLAVGDYVVAWAFQNSGGNLDVTTASKFYIVSF
jgi:hypothetical protein